MCGLCVCVCVCMYVLHMCCCRWCGTYLNTQQHTHHSGVSPLQAPGTLIRISKWRWTAGLAHSVASTLATSPHPRLSIQSDLLTDGLLSALLVLSPYLYHIDFFAIKLHSMQHADAPCPWQSLSVDMGDLADMVRLPWPKDGEDPIRVSCHTLDITSDGIKQVRLPSTVAKSVTT